MLDPTASALLLLLLLLLLWLSPLAPSPPAAGGSISLASHRATRGQAQ
jgi:hypothetical protein